MMLKNTIRILFSNFSTTWKIILFRILFLGLTALITMHSLSKINSFLEQNQVWTEIGNLFSFYNMTNNLPMLFDKLYLIFNSLSQSILQAFAVYPADTIFVCFSIFFLLPFFMNLCNFAVAECLFGSMGSGAKFGFTASFIGNLGKSLWHSFLRTLVVVPLTFAVIWNAIKFYELFQQFPNLQFLMPIAIILTVLIYFSVVFTMFSGFLPANVVHNNCTIKSFMIGINATLRKFLRVLSTAIILVFAAIITSLLLGPWGVIALSSFFSYLLLIFEMVAFFEETGMRYYVDFRTIISPKKPHEIATISKLKRVI